MNRATPIDDKSSQIVQFYLRNHTEEQTKAANAIAFDRQVTLMVFVSSLKVSYCSF